MTSQRWTNTFWILVLAAAVMLLAVLFGSGCATTPKSRDLCAKVSAKECQERRQAHHTKMFLWGPGAYPESRR